MVGNRRKSTEKNRRNMIEQKGLSSNSVRICQAPRYGFSGVSEPPTGDGGRQGQGRWKEPQPSTGDSGRQGQGRWKEPEPPTGDSGRQGQRKTTPPHPHPATCNRKFSYFVPTPHPPPLDKGWLWLRNWGPACHFAKKMQFDKVRSPRSGYIPLSFQLGFGV